MSKTYREVFDDDVEEINVKKIKHVDKKHQKAKVTDGAYKHGLYDEDGVYYDTPKQKKILKKIKHKHNRDYDDYDWLIFWRTMAMRICQLYRYNIS